MKSFRKVSVRESVSSVPSSTPSRGEQAKVVLTIGSETLYGELADTVAKRTQGLSGKENLPENEGMLFIFDAPNFVSFWMKDMNFPIDIVWINEEKQIIGWEENVDPNTYPATFSPKEEIVYVLEVNAGCIQRHDIQIGQAIAF